MSAEDWILGYEYEDGNQEGQLEILTYLSIRHQTEKAILFNTEKGLLWIPKSLCEIEPDDTRVMVPSWFKQNYFTGDK